MGGDLFGQGIVQQATFRWLPGASGASVDGYRLYIDGSLAATLPAGQNSASLKLPPGVHTWTVEAYNNTWGASPQAAPTIFWYPYYFIFPVIRKP
jgi:hypothetical protein